MAKKVNYRQIFATKQRQENELRKRFPQMRNKPAIYIYHRKTQDGELKMYIGQSQSLLDRTISHIQGWKSHLDMSLKKWGWYDKDINPYGWQLYFYYCPKNELDNLERAEIQKWQEKNATLLNITSGGQNEGKTDINERKPTKTYTDGVAYGTIKTKRKVKEFFDKYLDYSIKGKPNKIKERKLAEFGEFIADNKESGE